MNKRLKTKITYTQPEHPLWTRFIMQVIEYACGRRQLERKINTVLDTDPTPLALWGCMLDSLNIKLNFDGEKLDKVGDGPLVFIANHPYGVVDGLALGYLASLVRSEFKFLVNAVLCKEEKLNQFFLPVDFEESKEALQTNIETRKRAIQHLMAGEAILLFPSGGVATAPQFWMKAEDLEWKKFVLKLIKRSGATVVPIHFPGQNSRLFHFASQINLHLRLSLLLREVKNKQNMELNIAVGDPIPEGEWNKIPKKGLLSYFKKKVDQLAVTVT